jgi:hypothetical protein
MRGARVSPACSFKWLDGDLSPERPPRQRIMTAHPLHGPRRHREAHEGYLPNQPRKDGVESLVLQSKIVLPCNAWEKQTAGGASCSEASLTFVSWP